MRLYDAGEVHGAGAQRGTNPTWSSGDQILVLYHKKKFKDMTSRKQESTNFIKAKTHT